MFKNFKKRKQKLSNEYEIFKAEIEKKKEELTLELEKFKAEIKHEKRQLDRDYFLEKKQLELELDINIHERKKNNWKQIEEIRFETYNKKVLLLTEIATLEGKRDSLKKDQSEEIQRLYNIVKMISTVVR